MTFKKYPFNGNNKSEILHHINSNIANLKIECEDNDLSDLINKMLQIDKGKRISWKDYLNHRFFVKNISKEFPKDCIKCIKHNKNISSYCKECHSNICELCFEEHQLHDNISFSKIGFSGNELNEINTKLEKIDEEISKYKEKKKNIEILINNISSIKGKENTIYEDDRVNNYKQFYINYLESFQEQIKKMNELNLLNIERNCIICEYTIKKDKTNQKILNCVEETQRNGFNIIEEGNENEIKDNCELFLNDQKIKFCYKNDFEKEGKYVIKLKFNKIIKNLSYMFHGCSSLTSLNLCHFNINNVNNMRKMFHNCDSLKYLNLSYFNINNITNTSYLFSNCYSLISLNLFNFNTNETVNMEGMFSGCKSLTDLKLSNFNTNKVINMKQMFIRNCSLKSLDLFNFNTSKVIDMSNMFSHCSSLTSLNVSKFDTKNVTNMMSMFFSCSSLKSLDLSNFNTNKVNNMDSLFSDCTSLNSLNLSKNFITNKVTKMCNMFNNCTSLTSLNLSHFDTNSVNDMSNMFNNCSNLTSLNLSNFNTYSVINMKNMFNNCTSLSSLNLSHFNTNNVSDMSNMFHNCTYLSSLDLSHFNTNNVSDMSNMFHNCISLTSLNLLNFNAQNVHNIKDMFLNINNKCKIITNDSKLKIEYDSLKKNKSVLL